MRSFSLALSITRSMVHLTSAAVKGLPSCHLTPWRNGKVSSVPSSFHDQLVARSGTIERRLFCGTSCLNMTRLLKMPDIGRLTACVDSSSIDMLAGLSKWPRCRIPPAFWATAASGVNNASDSEPAATSARSSRFIRICLLFEDAGLVGPQPHPCRPVYWALMQSCSIRRLAHLDRADHGPKVGAGLRLFIEPHVFHAQAVVDAVDHRDVALHIGLPARARPAVIEDRTGRLRPACARSPKPVPCALPGRIPSTAGRPSCRARDWRHSYPRHRR